jgi:manganese transport protein
MRPPTMDILKGLIPNVPDVSADSAKGPFLVIASMVGPTVFSGLFIIRTTLVKEAGWTIKDMKHQRNDAIVSALMMFVLSGSIMAAAAGTMHAEGLVLTRASQMITLLEPLVGSLATAVFAIGIIAAGVSSQFPNVLMLPWLLCDYNESERTMTLPRYRVMVLIISLLGLVVPIFHARPVYVMVVSQALQSVVLPLTVGCILYLGNRKDLMGEHKNKLPTNLVLIAILILSTVTTYMGITGVCQKIASILGS